MSRGWSWLGLAALLAALGGGLGWIFEARLARDLYPPYSSLRADPLGVRALHDALATLPGLNVRRWFQPLAELPAGPPRTIFVLGADADEWRDAPPEDFNALDAAVRAGSRLVVVFSASSDLATPPATPARKKPAPVSNPAHQDPAKGKAKAAPAKPAPKDGPVRPDKDAPKEAPEHADWLALWGFETVTGWAHRPAPGAMRDVDAPAELPATLTWQSELHFNIAQGTPWRVLYTRGPTPVMMELARGRGSIVVASEAYMVSNEALQKERVPELLAWLVGPNRQVVFDESHLGVVEATGVAALARRYGLGGALGLLGLLAGLFAWRRLAPMVPPAVAAPGVTLTYRPAAGLEALLRRAVPTAKLPAVCRDEWRRTARPADVARLPTPTRDPAADYNATVRALRQR